MPRGALWGLVAVLLLLGPAHAWYLPGSAPRSFREGDVVPFDVNALQPMAGATPVHGLVSYDYYDARLGFCVPQNGTKSAQGSLGSILFGDRIYNGPAERGVPDGEIRMLRNQTCVPICNRIVLPKQAQFINERIVERYGVNWMVDGLPVADVGLTSPDGSVRANSVGFALGSILDADLHRLDPPALHNHYVLNVSYHERAPNEYRVVGVNVMPMSLHSLPGGDLHATPHCDVHEAVFLSPDTNTTVAYTYSVAWTPSATPWATRWDAYLHVVDPRIHWYSLLNSIAIVALLCVMVALIMTRAVRRDIYRYNAIDLTEDIQEDYGWKLVHGEVFRPPPSGMLLSVMAGSGAQLAAMATVTLLFALLGFLSPSNRGSLATIMIVTWTVFGSVSGWVSAKVYASFDGEQWRRNMLLTALLFPSVIFGAMCLLNMFLVLNKSAGAVPFGTLLALLALWFLINVPLSFLGSYVGLRSGAFSHPVRVNQIPRQIPPCPWYMRVWPSALLAGILPFGAAWLELFFIINSLFGNRVYYAFGFLSLTFLVTAATTATVAILACYFHLCAEDYRWQWRAFITGGASAFWLFVYGLFYCFVRLNLSDFSSQVLFLGYLFMIFLLDFLLFGFIGFIACYICVRRIYSHIRVD
ncbi:hypothetical protein MSPP1_003137 [Malassezia sp. CBS 17886]|nr:hypothetical protein MSPP1_003137 [Malassezia sp. CBS 17886]